MSSEDTISPEHFTGNISIVTHENNDFRRIINNSSTQQLIVMCLNGKEDTGYHKHPFSSQFSFIEDGNGSLYIGNTQYKLEPGVAVVIPPGVPHMIVNDMKYEALKLYTIYSPPVYEKSSIRNTQGSERLDKNFKLLKEPFYDDLESLTLNNNNYRHVLYTTTQMQLVLMSLLPKQEIGMEAHPYLTQFFRVEKGEGLADVCGARYILGEDSFVVVPPNTQHNIINSSAVKSMKLYTIYAPPNHADGKIDIMKPRED